MEREQLIEQITSLVMEHLQAPGAITGIGRKDSPGEPPPGGYPELEKAARGLFVFSESSTFLQESWEHFRALSRYPIDWMALEGEGLPASLLKKELGGLRFTILESLPPSWKTMIRSFDLVVIPVLTFTLSSKIANLIADDLPSRLIIQALIEKKPVIAGMEELTFLTRHSAQLPKPLVAAMNTHSEAAKSMGIREIQLRAIEMEVGRLIGAAGKLSRGNNVITRADIDAALMEGRKTLELARGTIVTPLAREFAEKMNLKILIL